MVPAQGLQPLFGAPKGRLGVHHPVVGPEGGEELAKSNRIGQTPYAPREAKRSPVEGPPQPGEVFPPEDAGQRPDREEEAPLCGEPPGPIARQRPAGDHAVEMEVLDQGLSPGVQDGDDPEFAPEVPGIVAEGGERRRRCLEQQVVDDPRVPLGQGIERMR